MGFEDTVSGLSNILAIDNDMMFDETIKTILPSTYGAKPRRAGQRTALQGVPQIDSHLPRAV
jgi:hypothetical protein